MSLDTFDLIKELEERLLTHVIRIAPDKVAALLADDFLEFGRSGMVYRKDEVVRSLSAELADGSTEVAAYSFDARALGHNVVLLTYRTTKKRRGVVDAHALRSSVWTRKDGRWQMAFHQGTPTSSSS